ncbi:MAG: hypothetical protein HN802_04995 [Candidatus Jacksonbacteria bacterium]|nr:hypothetical protein [Candidatus Jacksonbacteria bacterium]
MEVDQPLDTSLSFQIRDKQAPGNAVFKDSVGLYSFSGPDFEKYGKDNSIRDLSKTEAV